MPIICEKTNTLEIIHPAPGVSIERALLDVDKTSINHRVIGKNDLPVDRLFRKAWRYSAAGKVPTDLAAAKLIAHDLRRADRESKLKPIDDEINHNITNSTRVAQLEADRKIIRDANTVVQTVIDASVNEGALRAVLATL